MAKINMCGPMPVGHTLYVVNSERGHREMYDDRVEADTAARQLAKDNPGLNVMLFESTRHYKTKFPLRIKTLRPKPSPTIAGCTSDAATSAPRAAKRGPADVEIDDDEDDLN